MDDEVGSNLSVDSNEPIEIEDTYEQERMENIKKNAAIMASLGLDSKPSIRPREVGVKKPALSDEEQRTRRQAKAKAALLKRQRQVEPTRRSSRVAAKESSTPLISLSDDFEPDIKKTFSPIPKKVAPVIPSGPEYEPTRPLSSAPRPERGSDGRLIFEGRWNGIFTPNITPEEMFKGGAFAGAFFCDTYSNILKKPLHSKDDLDSLPFTVEDRLICNQEPDGDLNRFRVRAGQSLQEWEKAGWIWKEDPRGWAQWYTRFWDGRRCEDDERQVRRWLKVAGPTGRFKRALLKKIHQAGGEIALGDEDVGRVLRQCLWQWGYELDENEYRRAMEE